MNDNPEKDCEKNLYTINYGDLSVMELMSIGKEIIHQLSNLDVLGSQTKIQENVDYIEKLKEEYVAHGTNEIMKLVKTYTNKIRAMLEKVKVLLNFLEFDLSDYFKDKETEIENLASDLLKSFKKYIDDIQKKCLDVFEKLICTLHNVKEEINKLPSEFSSSVISWNPQVSITEFLQKLNGMSRTIPNQITDIAKEATDVLNDLPESLKTNLKDIVDEMDKTSARIVLDIALCVAGKIRDKTLKYLTD